MREERKAVERLAAFLVCLVLGLLALRYLAPVLWHWLSPFLLSVPVAALLQPLIAPLQRRLKMKRSPATLLITVLLTLVLLVLIVWFLSYGVGQLVGLLSNAGPLLTDIAGRIRAAINRLLASMERMPETDVRWIQSISNDALAWLTEQLTTLASWLMTMLVNTASAVPYGLVYANFLLLSIYFVAKDYPKLRPHLPAQVRQRQKDRNAATELTHSAISGLAGFVKVQTIYALVALVCSVLFWQVAGSHYAAVAGIAAGALELIPLFGCGVLYIPWALIALLLGDLTSSLCAIGIYTGLLLIRRLTEPRLLSNSIGVPPMVSLMGMFVGLQIGGVVGLVAGPVVATVLMDVWRGRYLAFVPRDLRTLSECLHRRWRVEDRPEPPAPAAPEPAAPAAPNDPPAQEETT